jgi:hypothetical protein
MKNRTAPVFAAILALAASFAAASFAAAQTSQPVAYIYVSSNYSGSNDRVVGYAAAADGKLTEISGSPWADNLSYLATSGSLLFGSTNIATDNGKNIFSYTVESNGALKYIGATNIQDDGSGNACNFAENLTLDHTGSYLYAYVENAGGCNGDSYGAFQSFAVNKSTGLLKYEGVTSTLPPANYVPLSMLADNDYAYTAGIYTGGVDALQKTSNGSLVILSGSSPAINTAGMPSGWGYDYGTVAADPTNHLAVDVCFASDGGAYGCDDTEDKIATFAINTSNGAESTSSTFSNMTTTQVQPVDALAMAPGGKLLAVAGANGVQIFNFNPNGQATANTGLITTAPISVADAASALYWDNNNHLYVLSNADNALHVFTVTATSAVEASGSPYSIPHPVAMTGHSMAASSGSPSAQYEASWGATTGIAGSGQISIDTSGNVTVQLSGAADNASYTLEFCPVVSASSQDKNPPACFDVGTVATNASGSADTSVKFPKSGSWAGDFQLNLGTRYDFSTTYTPVYLAQLQPESTVNEGDLNVSGSTQPPLSSGSVSYANGSFQFTLTGTSPNTPFQASQSETTDLDGSGSYALNGTFTSNSSGDLTFSDAPSGAGGDLMAVGPTNSNSAMGFFGGFSVP